ncbi:MAG: CZB domain-containing protein, partial [Planctomycetales bacterium]|nr:CZB domain-containing protein [Planctomycetales bacterium]
NQPLLADELQTLHRMLCEPSINLTARMAPRTAPAEQAVADAVNDALSHWSVDVHTVSDEASELAGISVELAANSNQIASETQLIGIEMTSMAASSEQLKANLNGISASAQQMSYNTRTLAAAAEEMSTCIEEVAKNSSQSALDADSAAHRAVEANTTMQELGEAAQGIGKVVETIRDIAERTKLLALNATIEAARAGTVGRGFAVVATEVKELARQSAEATEDIQRRIAHVQEEVLRAEEAVGSISADIRGMSQSSQAIAVALAQQKATTQEMAIHVAENSTAADAVAMQVTEAATACGLIAKSVTEVEDAVNKAALCANESQHASDHLTRISDALLAFVQKRTTTRCRFDATAIRVAHGKWRVRLSEMIAGRRKLNPQELADHTQCAFGKWYNTTGRVELGHLPSFASIDAKHAAVHEMAKKILDLFHAGKRREAAVQLSQFPALTHSLFQALDQLEAEANAQPI